MTIPRPPAEQSVITWCPPCGGDKGFAYPLDYCRITGALIEGWEDCTCCNGTGEVEEPVRPVEEDDLDDWIGPAA